MQTFPLGAVVLPNGVVHFQVWAPNASQVELHWVDRDLYQPMQPDALGYFSCHQTDMKPGDRYFYRLNGAKERPDPATRSQPEGVHGPSQVVDLQFEWEDQGWLPHKLRNTVFYELHVGTFTPEGTFEAVIPHLPRLKALGVTTLELMPVAQFPGGRNWGYDGVQLYAPHSDYGGVVGLQRLVNACHREGLAVFLDAVYNHLGPEGNYLWDYGSYFTNRYTTPWGASLNFDGPYSDAVRRFFIDNAIYWMEHFHIDGLRLDATHALYDFSAIPFLEDLAASVNDWADRNNRRVLLVAENDACDRRLVMPREANGYGMNGQWLDDLHHGLHCALTGEYDGYYADFERFDLLVKVLREGFAYTGQYSPSRKRKQGTSARDLPADRFVVCTQNHDQVGNRMLGERLTQLTDFDGLKLAAGLVCLSPYVPLLFMGEEYGETAPFLYFISHGDQTLVDAVRRGREDEFAAFKWRGEPPDPQAESTFTRSKLDPELRHHGYHAILDRLYTNLLRLRRELPALTNPNRDDTQLYADVVARIVCLERRADTGDEGVRLVMNFNLTEPQSLPLPADGAPWQKVCDSQAGEWRIDGESAATAPEVLSARQPTTITLPPRTFVLYERLHESRG